MRRKILCLLCFSFFNCITISAQKKTWELGGKLISEWVNWKSYGPGAGLQVLYKITNHSGIETGLYYKANPRYYYFSDGLGNSSNKIVKEKALQLPLLYRFASHLINFTAGAAVDYFLNRKKLQRDMPQANWYNTKSLELVTTASISRSFDINETLVFEPEIRASAYVPAGGGGFGFNLSLRKKLF